jgi:hypothetical protein
MTATCPNCGDELDIPEQFVSRPIRCGACQSVFSPQEAQTGSYINSRESQINPEEETIRHSSERRGNGGVWVLGLLAIIVFGSCAGGCVLSALLLYFPTFESVALADGQFTVAFPDSPQPVSQVWDDAISATGLECRREFTQERYFALVADLPAREWQTGAETLLPQVGAWVAGQVPGRRESLQAFTFHDGYEAFDLYYTAESLPEGLILRVVRVGKRVIVVGVEGAVAPNDPRAQEFFLRFRIQTPQE